MPYIKNMKNAANTNAGETQTTVQTGKLVRIMNLTDRFGNVEIGHGAVILPGIAERVSTGHTAYDRTFSVGEVALYGGMNLDYTGTITSITAKTVTIQDGQTVKRLTIADFARKNRFFSAEASAKRNAEWLD